VLLAAATGFLYWALVSNLDREDDEFLADKVHVLRALLRERPGDSRMLEEEVQWEPAARRYGQVYVRVLDREGKLILETPGMGPLLPPDVFPDPGAADGEPGRGAEFVRVEPLQPVVRREAGDLAAVGVVETGGVEHGDRADDAAAGTQAGEELLDADADAGDGADPGDHDSRLT
jgi:hypothetical protein